MARLGRFAGCRSLAGVNPPPQAACFGMAQPASNSGRTITRSLDLASGTYILCGCESWETLPPTSRLTTAYQSLNRGDSTLGGLGRCSWGTGLWWATFLPSGQPGTAYNGLFEFSRLGYHNVHVGVCFADHDVLRAKPWAMSRASVLAWDLGKERARCHRPHAAFFVSAAGEPGVLLTALGVESSCSSFPTAPVRVATNTPGLGGAARK